MAGTSLATKAMALAFGAFDFGHQAVILFFVLSGFCIHYRQAQVLLATATGAKPFSFDARSYIWRRLYRIAPPITSRCF
jgi:peptidoglycan/LPS O-acetylase OafA/YrhL